MRWGGGWMNQAGERRGEERGQWAWECARFLAEAFGGELEAFAPPSKVGWASGLSAFGSL